MKISIRPPAHRTSEPGPQARRAGSSATAGALGLLAALGLGGLGGCQTAEMTPKGPWDGPAPALAGAEVSTPRGGVWTRIGLIEESRSTGSGRLIELLLHESPAVRERACRALGRLRYPAWGEAITQALATQLADEEPGVRRAAAFALGQRADPGSAGILINYGSDRDESVRTALVRAAGALDVPQVRAEVLRAMRDPSLAVRIEAAQATAMWKTDQPDSAAIDSSLLQLLRPQTGDTEVPPELVWRTLYALGRRGSTKGRGAYLQFAGNDEPLVRLFAAIGLGKVTADGATAEALEQALADSDWRVVVEAANALGSQTVSAESARANALLAQKAVEHSSVHVRRAAFNAIGKLKVDDQGLRSTLYRGLRDLSASVRASALEALARVMPPEEALTLVEEHRRDADPTIRIGVARAAGSLPTPLAVPILLGIVDDYDPAEPSVAGAALAELGRHPNSESRTRLRETLGHPDNGLRLAALQALGTNPRTEDAPLVRRMLRNLEGDIANEITQNVANFMREVPGSVSRTTLTELLAHPNAFVRDRAATIWREVYPLQALPRVISPEVETPDLGGSLEVEWGRNPILELATTRGSMYFELFPAEAPVHVYNFVALALRGHYDGLVFHRVVPDFVIQGGCYRGDGNGALDWRGSSLRQEIGERKFRRGSLGMPRNDDPESGGSQIFVTHRPTPHLDGRYTLFGELRLGFEVLDRIDVGDHILGARLIDPSAAAGR